MKSSTVLSLITAGTLALGSITALSNPASGTQPQKAGDGNAASMPKGTGVVKLAEVAETFAKLCKYEVTYGKGVEPEMGIQVDMSKLRCKDGLAELAAMNKLELRSTGENKYVIEQK